ncbi:hypothetical protein [Thiospirillum jenense]|uniref:Uncharacterized protein n=1 Tax=Thiospirillum jenense TaxID=1653858 RepID=A0A839HAN3_9GAMM|nr:hypothetical protein [Thiospirillum jenense]MBB1125861.1 hypothetical protein [Thiospirillum jenense]
MTDNSNQHSDDSIDLSDIMVVDELVRQFISNVLSAEEMDDIYVEVDHISTIFSGMVPQYTSPNNWLSRDNIGESLIENYDIDGSQDLLNIVRTAFAEVIASLFDLIEKYADNPSQAEPEVDAIIAKLVLSLVGMPVDED